MELARKHSEIIEREIKDICELHDCCAEDIILEVNLDINYRILIKAREFTIKNSFIVDGKVI